jgi:hypothetical protein
MNQISDLTNQDYIAGAAHVLREASAISSSSCFRVRHLRGAFAVKSEE